MRLLRLLSGGAIVAALSLVSLPRDASAYTQAVGLLGTNPMAVNNVEFGLDITCAGSFCPFLFPNPFSQSQNSTLTGGTGLFVDDVADTMRLSNVPGTGNFLGAAGTPFTFTAVPPSGANINVTNLVMGAFNAGLANVAGLNLFLNGSGAFPFVMSVPLMMAASANTDSPAFPVLGIAPTPVFAAGTLLHLPDGTVNGPNGLPDFGIQDLRGTFSLTTYSQLGTSPGQADLTIIVRATFTMNMLGELMGVPEPASILLVGLGVAGFGMAAQRRKAS